MHFRSNQEYLQYLTSPAKHEDLREAEKQKREVEEQPREEGMKLRRGRKSQDG